MHLDRDQFPDGTREKKKSLMHAAIPCRERLAPRQVDE